MASATILRCCAKLYACAGLRSEKPGNNIELFDRMYYGLTRNYNAISLYYLDLSR